MLARDRNSHKPTNAWSEACGSRDRLLKPLESVRLVRGKGGRFVRGFVRVRGLVRFILAATLLTGLAAPTVGATAARAAVSCPTMQVVGVRGSGQTADDDRGYGHTVVAVVDAIRKVNPTAAAAPINYPAIGIDYWNPKYYTENYEKSVRAGRAALRRYISQFLESECGATTYLYLVGYSQGAHVVGDVYQGLSDRQRPRVAGVVLIADPRFRGAEGSPVNVGTYERDRNGIWDVAHTPRIISKNRSHVRSYCALYDPVCNFRPRNVTICKLAGSRCPHSSYMRLKPSKSKLPYTTVAANYLISRWRRVGPKPPQVGPRSSILIFGNGDVGESSTGVPNLTSALTSAGYTVDYSETLPADLSPYGQVWWYGIETLTADQQVQLGDYARTGGSLYLTGEYNGCCASPSNSDIVANISDSLIVTVGGLQFGADNFDVPGTMNVNPGALNSAQRTPNILSTFTGRAIGSMSSNNIGSDNFLVTNADGNGVIGLWDNTNVVGAGRLAIVMDVNWAQTEFGDMLTMPQVAQNIAYFLSGATSPAITRGTFIPAPAEYRVSSRRIGGVSTRAAG